MHIIGKFVITLMENGKLIYISPGDKDYLQTKMTVEFGNSDISIEQMLDAFCGCCVASSWSERQILTEMYEYAKQRLEAWHPEYLKDDELVAVLD